ncbi:hypothetical protein EF913_03710 [Streptomyces sp. WAC04189]|uniref:hypothetical protein n=1 Tax=Streptomyces sp. WAC04189 TaxID=2487411 RepID=UPI000FB95FE6|nr:hypothetical protein [Streptomyces sp. WAC04189]RSS06245.1 hypothetical protein EF913_03710 [Streptomyces sp. WAC04189]
MGNFRAEAERIYETTRDTDTRGIIAAILHLADTIAPAATGPTHSMLSITEWQEAVLAYLRGKVTREKSASRIREWLASQSYEVDLETVQRGLWELVAVGLVTARTSGASPVFAAARS